MSDKRTKQELRDAKDDLRVANEQLAELGRQRVRHGLEPDPDRPRYDVQMGPAEMGPSPPPPVYRAEIGPATIEPTASDKKTKKSANPYAYSDESSKKKIDALEGELAQTYAALGRAPAATSGVRKRDVDFEGLDRAQNRQQTPTAGFDLRPAQAYSYEYKDPARHGQGRFVGPMAQDLEKTPVGKSVVRQAPDGTKMVDTSRLSLVNTGAISEQQRRGDMQQRQLNQQDAKLSRLLDELNTKKMREFQQLGAM